jgi:hypothetical protein
MKPFYVDENDNTHLGEEAEEDCEVAMTRDFSPARGCARGGPDALETGTAA